MSTSTPLTLTGRCLCGAVALEATTTRREFDACHCSRCRGWSGGPLMTLFADVAVEVVEGADSLSVYDSSAWAERAFCRRCGTHLFYRLKAGPQYFLPIGLFGDVASAFQFSTQIFVDEKPRCYDFANATEMMTGAEVFAKFAPPDTAVEQT